MGWGCREEGAILGKILDVRLSNVGFDTRLVVRECGISGTIGVLPCHPSMGETTSNGSGKCENECDAM